MTNPTPDPLVAALAYKIARWAYGYYNGNSVGSGDALKYWDGVGHDLPGPKFTVEIVQSFISPELTRLQAALAEKEKELTDAQSLGAELVTDAQNLRDELTIAGLSLAASQQRVASLEKMQALEREHRVRIQHEINRCELPQNIILNGVDQAEDIGAIIDQYHLIQADRERMKAALDDFVHNVKTHNIAGRGEWHTYTDASFRILAAIAAPAAQAATEEKKPEPVFGNVSFCPVCHLMRTNSHECNASDAPKP